MNDRIKELAIQAGLACESSYGLYPLNNDLNRLERFAELVRQDEREQISHTYLKLTLEAAPDLLEALEEFLRNPGGDYTEDIARTAIAKATGKTE